MAAIKFLGWSDIHYHYYTNGITVNDVENVDMQALELGVKHDVDAFLFGGDWFADKNPDSSLRAMRDKHLKAKTEFAPVIAIMGNHDRETKGMFSSHNLESASRWYSGDNLHVFDRSATRIIEIKTAASREFVQLTACPAGHKLLQPPARQNYPNIMMFHDMVKGSYQQNGQPSEHGIYVDELDSPEYDIVLGGDNHVRQKLETARTPAYYFGAPMQHNWGDSGQKRGFTIITIDNGYVQVDFIESKSPRFIGLEYVVGSLDDYTRIDNLVADIPDIYGNIIKITLTGDARLLCDINKLAALENSIKIRNGARSVKAIPHPVVVFKEIIPSLKLTKTPTDDWKAFVASGKFDVTGLDPDKLVQYGNELINLASDANHGPAKQR